MDRNLDNESTTSSISRRSFITKGSLGVAAVAAGGGLLLAGCGSANSSGAPAASTSGHSLLDQIIASKKIRIGLLVANPPYGTYDSNNNPIGYDMDITNMVAKDLGATPVLTVLPDSATRITALVSGRIDLVVAAFTMTAARSEAVAFTIPYGPDTQVLLGRKSDTSLHTYLDYDGKKIAITAGSTQEILAQLNPKVNVTRFPDDATGYQAFVTGQVDGWVGQGETVAHYVSLAPTEYESKGLVTQGYLCLGTQRGDLEWLRWLNDCLYYHGGQGQIAALYKKWFEIDMPRILPNY